MSDTWISARLRREVELRAGRRCEYCHIRDEDTFLGMQVDHVISEKHGGQTTAANLALACTLCNRSKGSDIAAIDDDDTIVLLFHPRKDIWEEHFRRSGK